jgi:oxalate---CoA ligase
VSTLTKRLKAALADKEKTSIYDSNVWFTNEQFQQDKISLIKILNASGIRPGDRVILGYPNSYAFLVTYLAVLEYGAIVVPVNPNMPFPELYDFLIRSQAATAFLTQDKWIDFSSKGAFSDIMACHELPLRQVFCIDSTSSAVPNKKFTWSEFNISGQGQLEGPFWENQYINIPSEPCDFQEPSDDALGVIMFTSGTTGKPKAVGLKHRHLLATAENIVVSHKLTPNDVTYCFLPLCHINAQVVAFLSTLLSGGQIVLTERFSASRFWSTIKRHNVTWVSAVPTIITILLKTAAPEEIPSSLRFVRSASAQLPKLHHEQFEEKFGIPVIQAYGMTEAASQICVNPFPPAKRRVGSVGLPIGVKLIISDDDGSRLNQLEIGEIAIQGKGVVEYYEEAESQKEFREGWFFTGDVGYVDEDGYVFITGRKKEMINRAGEKVSPYEVEDVIRQYPGVLQVAVIGLPDAFYGEHVAAYVQVNDSVEVKTDCGHERITGTSGGYTGIGAGRSVENGAKKGISTAVKGPITEDVFVQELMAYCKSAISTYKCPSEIHLVSTLPVGQTGKIQRSVLKSQVLSEILS